MIDHIDVVRTGKVRRAKLYYLRKLKGKAARLKERSASKRGGNGAIRATSSGNCARGGIASLRARTKWAGARYSAPWSPGQSFSRPMFPSAVSTTANRSIRNAVRCWLRGFASGPWPGR